MPDVRRDPLPSEMEAAQDGDLVFRVSHFEHDDTYITSWDEIETIPRHCPWCGAEVVDDE